MLDRLQATASRVWSDMNPKEPSPYYLAKLMAVMLACFAFGLAIHFAQVGA